MTAESYCERILPLLATFKREDPNNLIMHDGVPCHSPCRAQRSFAGLGITPIGWPPISPELNLIELVWNSMKNHIQFKNPELSCGQRVTDSRLRKIFEATRESVIPELLSNLDASVEARCQAVLDANGGHSHF